MEAGPRWPLSAIVLALNRWYPCQIRRGQGPPTVVLSNPETREHPPVVRRPWVCVLCQHAHKGVSLVWTSLSSTGLSDFTPGLCQLHLSLAGIFPVALN